MRAPDSLRWRRTWNWTTRAQRSYRVTVQVTDGRDRNGDDDNDVIDDTINVTINVTNVNEAPTVSGEATATFTENESGAIGTYTGTDPERDTLTWSVSGTDSDSFAMTDRGRLHFASPPSFEGGKTEYEVTVVATDEGALTGMLEVTVTVEDVEEEGTVTIAPPRGWSGTQFSGTQFSGTQFERRPDRRRRYRDQRDLAVGPVHQPLQLDRHHRPDVGHAYTATADDIGNYLRVSTEYTDRTGSGKTAEAVLAVRIADAADKLHNECDAGVCGRPRLLAPSARARRRAGPSAHRCGRGTRTPMTSLPTP